MNIVGTNLGTTRNNGKHMNFSTIFKLLLEELGINSFSNKGREKNEKFNIVLRDFYDSLECLSLFLFQRGYEQLKIFKSEKALKDYIKNNRIKMKIKNGELLVGNIYGEIYALECIGIVLAKKNPDFNEKTNNILKS